MKWIKGRQGTGYLKKKIFGCKWIDLWLLKYPVGSYIPRHKDACSYGDIFRLNITLRKGEGGAFYCFGKHTKLGSRILWFNASKVSHMVSEVFFKPRYVLSLGIVKPCKKDLEEPIQYDCYSSCNRCSGENEIIPLSSEQGFVSEVFTTCKDCGFEDNWAFGFYESSQEGYNSCRKYCFRSNHD